MFTILPILEPRTGTGPFSIGLGKYILLALTTFDHFGLWYRKFK